jgi:hypothetical protein
MFKGGIKKGSNFDPFFDDFSNKTFHILIAGGDTKSEL